MPESGRIVRFAVDGDSGDKRSGYYRFHGDYPPNGEVGDWKSGHKFPWRGQGVAPVAAERIERERQERIDRIKREREAAALIAQMRWRAGGVVSSHPYLTAKGIKPFGVRREGRLLIMPVVDRNGDITSMQSIAADGSKLFQKKGMVEGGVFVIGPRPSTWDGPILLCEGYATAATLHEATGMPVVIAFNAGNMVTAAGWLTRRFAGREWIICGDDDWSLPLREKPLKNAGQQAAARASEILKGRFVLPDRRDRQWTDFNDQAQEFGLDDVRRTVIG